MKQHTVSTLKEAYGRYRRFPGSSPMVLAAMDTLMDRLCEPIVTWHQHKCACCKNEFECNCASDPLGEHDPMCGDCENSTDGLDMLKAQREDDEWRDAMDEMHQAQCYEVRK